MSPRGEGKVRRTVSFVLDGEVIELENVDPNRTLLQFLREDLKRTGTKEGCAEGDCGACTVVVAEVDTTGRRLVARAINACIRFLPTLDGKELLTVESLAGNNLHPVQQAMVDCHGSQCGFCTPGFVMSLFALYKENPNPTRREIDDALVGNLCRCTGYQPIINAAHAMYGVAPKKGDWTRLPAGTAVGRDEAERVERLQSLVSDKPLCVEWKDRRFFAPRETGELADLVEEHPDATILAGGTDIGLWVTKQCRDLKTMIYTGEVNGLKSVSRSNGFLDIGAAVSLSDAMLKIVEEYPSLNELFLRFASPPIRNAGTLAGNIANGSPIGDSIPVLMTLGTTLVLQKGSTTREISLDEFYLAYQQTALQAGEFILHIRIPQAQEGELVQCYKVSKRFDQDISAVCAAFRLVRNGDKVGEIAIAYGGMAEVPRRALRCEQVLAGSQWNDESVMAAMNALEDDFTPISDMRSTAAYRKRVCRNLLKRFFLETTGGLASRVYAYGR